MGPGREGGFPPHRVAGDRRAHPLLVPVHVVEPLSPAATPPHAGQPVVAGPGRADARVDRGVVSLFTSLEDLAARVPRDLPALIERSGTPIPRGELAKVVESLLRVTWLTPERFAYLKKAVAQAGEVAPSDEVLKDLMEFLLSGDRLAAVFLLERRGRLDLR